MAFDLKKPTRRQMLVGGGLAGGALLVGVSMSGPSRRERENAIAAEGGEKFVTTWLKISPDNVTTVYVPHSDMGQGPITALAMMAADEMDADWNLVRAEQAPAEPEFANESLGLFITKGQTAPDMLAGAAETLWYNVAKFMSMQITGGSMAVRYTGQHGMRIAGAAAKEMLVKAAAARWNCAASDCEVRDSVVYLKGKNRSATFGELAVEAAEYSPSATPTFKTPDQYRIVGRPTKRFDVPGKVDGSGTYGIDARPEGMLYAALRQSPVFGGKLKRYDASEILKRRGVKKVVELPVGVAVIADNFWRAKQAAAALDIEFDTGGNDAISSASIFEGHEKALQGDSTEDVEKGDAEGALKNAAKVVEAAYRVPYLAHATMEPMNCTVWVHDGKAEVWVGTQDPLGTRARVADMTGVDYDNVKVHPLLLGGGFGRRIPYRSGFSEFPSEIDYASLIAKEVDAPVKLVYTREDDMQHDAYRIAVANTMKAGLDEDGNPVAWLNRYVYKDEPAEAPHIPYAVENQSIRYVDNPTPVPRGPWRSVAHTQHTFFNESFMDELAHEAGKDPYEFRMALLKDKPRHRAVLQLAAEKAGLGKPLPEGRVHGIAVQQSFSTIVAEVLEVSLDEDNRPRVHKVTCAVDCGRVINPDTAEAQVQSAVIYGLTAALYGQITIEGGAVTQGNFPDYRMVTLAETPVIETHFIDSGEALGGLGEPGTPPVAPALANAVFKLTGKRIRELPMSIHDLSPASGKFAQAAD
ncbi:molybdopterin cofactor-binding domain-containing protein [Parvibaculum sp.]|uniref:xanthine dehydrogenase family protein molybdopterin-binding subunit n=1 Tax=Parvibaculum sp. TaxID=2024848 RepID=UPI000C96EF28|nr:molybdopterin cofactor-binding domain-containing protein [Parvibaculum sp.]MAB13959.1 isoquinoline 1-oxidoreductase [Parvibaculum sp.]